MTERLRFLTALCVCLMASSVHAVAKTDMAGLPICTETGGNIPSGFRATQGYDCDRMSPMENCTFTLKHDGHSIQYLVQNGIIVTKTYRLNTKNPGPFSLTSLDTVKSSKNKLQKETGLLIKLFKDPASYLQSSEIICNNNNYTINIYFDKQNHAKELVISSLPSA